jgi:LacI family transcriptional regulator
MAANIKDVAKKAGVSTATVSCVINGTRFVREDTKNKVLASMDDLNYRPNLIARSLRSQKSKTVGLLIPDISNFYYTNVADGIERTLWKNGYHVLLSNSYEQVETEMEMIKMFNMLLLDGLIMIPALGDQSYLNKTLSGNYPVVFIERRPKGIVRDQVLLDNMKSAYDITKLFIEKGHKKIGLITGYPDISTTSDRIIGYKKALMDYNYPINESYIKMGEFTFESGYNSTKEIIENEHVTAVFYAGDIMAVGAMTYLKEKCIKIPDQVAIVSCNNFKWTQVTDPPLSVVEQPSYEVGQKAAEILLQRIKNPNDKEKFKEHRIPTKIIIRGSC